LKYQKEEIYNYNSWEDYESLRKPWPQRESARITSREAKSSQQ